MYKHKLFHWHCFKKIFNKDGLTFKRIIVQIFQDPLSQIIVGVKNIKIERKKYISRYCKWEYPTDVWNLRYEFFNDVS